MVSDPYVYHPLNTNVHLRLFSGRPWLYDPSTLSFRLATYNLRYDVKPDDISVKESLAALRDPTVEPSYLGLAGKEQPWSSRRIRIAQDLLSEGIALAGNLQPTIDSSTLPI